MNSITSKKTVAEIVDSSMQRYLAGGAQALVSALDTQLLQSKVKFPLLEYGSNIIFEKTDQSDHVAICDGISALQREGGNVVIGILLQLHLDEKLEPSVRQAAKYIAEGTEWYVADIIGERVMGHALLTNASKALVLFKDLSKHPSNLVVRSIGAGTHLALKRGLGKSEADAAFQILLSLANSKDHQIKRGIGWAAKTSVKFYPTLADKYRHQIEDGEKTGQWFRTKVAIGLARHAYAKGN